MAENGKPDWKLEIHPEVFEDLNQISQTDPKAAQALREALANMRQAVEGVNTGQYASVEDGIEAITGQRPTPVDIDDDENDPDTD